MLKKELLGEQGNVVGPWVVVQKSRRPRKLVQTEGQGQERRVATMGQTGSRFQVLNHETHKDSKTMGNDAGTTQPGSSSGAIVNIPNTRKSNGNNSKGKGQVGVQESNRLRTVNKEVTTTVWAVAGQHQPRRVSKQGYVSILEATRGTSLEKTLSGAHSSGPISHQKGAGAKSQVPIVGEPVVHNRHGPTSPYFTRPLDNMCVDDTCMSENQTHVVPSGSYQSLDGPKGASKKHEMYSARGVVSSTVLRDDDDLMNWISLTVVFFFFLLCVLMAGRHYSIFLWNCRGTASSAFFRVCK